MPQLQIYLPPTDNWQDLQTLVKGIAEVRYDPATVVGYGSQGQRQNGVDIYAQDFSGNKIGIQCKETKEKLTVKMVTDEASKANSFKHQLDLFIIATTSKKDKKIQDHVIGLNNSKGYGFKVRVDFWTDLVVDINRYALVLNNFYSTYRHAFNRTNEENHLACLRVAFDRPAFTDDFKFERNYDNFESALVDTLRLFKTGFTMDRWSQIPVIQTVPTIHLPDGAYRTFVTKLESLLSAIYKTYMSEKSRLAKSSQFGDNRAGHYNILRGRVLAELNNELKLAKLLTISPLYA